MKPAGALLSSSKSRSIIIFYAICASPASVLCGCAASRYSINWPVIDESQGTSCEDLSGVYAELGDSSTEYHTHVRLSEQLRLREGPDYVLVSRLTPGNKTETPVVYQYRPEEMTVELAVPPSDRDKISVVVRDAKGVRFRNSIEYSCDGGHIHIKTTHFHGGEDPVPRKTWSDNELSLAGDYLVVKIKSKEIGCCALACGMPFMATGTEYNRFRKLR